MAENSLSPLKFHVEAECGMARVAQLELPHHTFHTPMFMPVGTQGTVKGLRPSQLEALDVPIILGNTYHLGLRPGGDAVEAAGGLHVLERWKRNILTDSGGFQMVSLLKLAEISEAGVEFESPHDGTKMLLTPEHSMRLQNQIGADIMMALDAVVSSRSGPEAFAPAMERTLRWLDRCIAAHARPDAQALYGIVQGGLDDELRVECMREIERRGLPGHAVGGMSGGESKDDFWRIVALCCGGPKGLPRDKPRYVMGVGYPVDIVVCCALGADQFDCVYPTRAARFGNALTSTGLVPLKRARYADDHGRLDELCTCETCARYKRSFLHVVATRPLGCRLLSLHNVAYMMSLVRGIQSAIRMGEMPQFCRTFMRRYYPAGDVPSWVVDALAYAGIELGSWGEGN